MNDVVNGEIRLCEGNCRCNRPFYSCLRSDLAYEWLRGCR